MPSALAVCSCEPQTPLVCGWVQNIDSCLVACGRMHELPPWLRLHDFSFLQLSRSTPRIPAWRSSG